MPEVTIVIGGRNFEVACQEGEEHFLASAAAMLDTEARKLNENIGRVPEPKMLLMSGLMLADRTAALEDQVSNLQAEAENTPVVDTSAAEQEVLQLRAELANLKAELAEGEAKMAQSAAEHADHDKALSTAQNEAARAAKAANDAMAALTRMVEQAETLAQNATKAE